MGRKRTPGLVKRGGIWHIDKRFGGQRICQSTSSAELEEAETTLARIIEKARQARVYGVRPQRTFEQAAANFITENAHERSINDDVSRLSQLLPFIGQLALDRVHRGAARSLGRAAPQAARGGGHHQPRPQGGKANLEPRSNRMGR
jgi:hypothetical protein